MGERPVISRQDDEVLVVSVGDVELFSTDTGEGSPVLLVHGWPETSRIWWRNIGVLADAGFEVIAPDLRGLGWTPAVNISEGLTETYRWIAEDVASR